MSQAKFTASERADKCVLPLDLAVYYALSNRLKPEIQLNIWSVLHNG